MLISTAPLVTLDSLKLGYETILRERCLGVIPITEFDFPIWRSVNVSNSWNVKMNFPDFTNTRSQDLPSTYHDAGQWIWLDVEQFKTEPNIWGIINSLGQKLALPVFNHQTNSYDWGPYKQPLVPSKFNIPEPALAFDTAPKLDACLVPAVGIDLKGNRIGWGHGYFDRLLSINIPIRMGVIFNQQIIKPPITPNKWDVPLTHILTESGIINTSK